MFTNICPVQIKVVLQNLSRINRSCFMISVQHKWKSQTWLFNNIKQVNHFSKMKNLNWQRYENLPMKMTQWLNYIWYIIYMCDRKPYQHIREAKDKYQMKNSYLKSKKINIEIKKSFLQSKKINIKMKGSYLPSKKINIEIKGVISKVKKWIGVIWE